MGATDVPVGTAHDRIRANVVLSRASGLLKSETIKMGTRTHDEGYDDGCSESTTAFDGAQSGDSASISDRNASIATAYLLGHHL